MVCAGAGRSSAEAVGWEPDPLLASVVEGEWRQPGLRCMIYRAPAVVVLRVASRQVGGRSPAVGRWPRTARQRRPQARPARRQPRLEEEQKLLTVVSKGRRVEGSNVLCRVMCDIGAPGDVRHGWFGSLRGGRVEDMRDEDTVWRSGARVGAFADKSTGPAVDGYCRRWSAIGDCGDRVRQVADQARAVGHMGVERQVQL